MNIEQVSADIVRPSFSERFSLPAANLLGFGRSLLDAHSSTIDRLHYDDEGNEIDGQPRLFEDDIDWDKGVFHSYEEALTPCVVTEFVTVPDPRWPSDTYKALNSHIVTAINIYHEDMHSDEVMTILCAGNCEDVCRLVKQGLPRFRMINMVGASAPSPRAKVALRQLMVSGVRVNFLPHKLKHYDKEFHKWEKSSWVLCHQGMQHIMASKDDTRAFVEFLSLSTLPDFRFIGDFLDFTSLSSYSAHTTLPAHSVEIMDHIPEAPGTQEGIMEVRVKDTIWRDPILTRMRLNETFRGTPFVVSMMEGRGAFMHGVTPDGRRFVPPKRVVEASKRAEASLMTFVDIRVSGQGVLAPPIPPPIVPNAKWEERFTMPIHVSHMLSFPINKGKLLGAGDIHYISGGGHMAAEKTNGYGGRLLIGEGNAWLLIGFGKTQRIFFYPSVPRTGLPNLRLQVECLSDWGVPPSPSQLVINDYIDLGPRTPHGFHARLMMYHNMASNSPILSNLCVEKRWFSSISDAILAKERGGWEGLVIMGYGSPVPTWRISPALYVKESLTVDKLCSDGNVREYMLRDIPLIGWKNPIKDRPDKSFGNTPEDLKVIEGAVPWGTFVSIFALEYDREIVDFAMRYYSSVEISWGSCDWECLYGSEVPEDCGKAMRGMVMALRFPHRDPSPARKDFVEKILSKFVFHEEPPRTWDGDDFPDVEPPKPSGGGFMNLLGF